MVREDARKEQLHKWKRTTITGQPVRGSSDKENVRGMENQMDKIAQAIELKLQHKLLRLVVLSANLVSPFLRNTKQLDEATQQRLERLEKRLLTQTEEEMEHVVDTVLPEEEEEETTLLMGEGATEVVTIAMTPMSKINAAKTLIIRAKKLEQRADTAEALVDYRQGKTRDF